MKFPEKIYPVNFAGYIRINNGDYYDADDLMDEDSYPFAEAFANELCKRYHEYESLKNALAKQRAENLHLLFTLMNARTQIEFMNDCNHSESAEAALKSIDRVIDSIK